jgi:hypothetical protein
VREHPAASSLTPGYGRSFSGVTSKEPPRLALLDTVDANTRLPTTTTPFAAVTAATPAAASILSGAGTAVYL